MPRRERDYAAEYEARNQRSQEQWGISYNEQRAIREASGYVKDAGNDFLDALKVDNILNDFTDSIREVADLVRENREGDRSFEWIMDQLSDLGIDIDPDNIPEWLWYDD